MSSNSLFPLPSINLWCSLPSDIGHLISMFVDIDCCGYLYMISKQWTILPNEETYRSLCFYIFLSQSSMKKMNVLKWGTWKNMLILRPRLRTNGIYTLRTLYSKPPVNDRFWEEKIREFPEARFYRHLKFFNNGRLLYSLCNTPGIEIFPLMEHCIAQPNRKVIEFNPSLLFISYHLIFFLLLSL